MAESSKSKRKKRDKDNTTDHTYVPLKEAANDTSISPKLIAPPAGLTLLHTLMGHKGAVISVTWSPDGKLLASGSDDSTVRLWDPSSGQLLHTLEGHTSGVRHVAWSPDGQLLASCSSDHTVRVWDPSTGRALHTLEHTSAKGYTINFWDMAWSPGGTDRLSTPPPSLVKTMEQAADTQRDRESAASKLQGKIATQDFDVFLCHNGQDKSGVRKLSKQIREYGLLPWLDEEQLQPGLPWQPLLEGQITQIKAAAVFVGKDGIGPWQRQELDAFLREFVRRGCPVIPVLLANAPQEPRLPVFLNAMTWVDFRIQDPDPMQQLLWGITGKQEVGEGRREGG